MVVVEVLNALGVTDPLSGGIEVLLIIAFIYMVAKAFIENKK